MKKGENGKRERERKGQKKWEMMEWEIFGVSFYLKIAWSRWITGPLGDP
jgi:hypothetical protein